ncbi:thiamine-phosphate kinase [Janibacter sp. GS2]|uniref:thiamine-phosphate kinase n=1 Tax=Janibacter sp. GS2 TaxID=3442646 RepID=UPI003EC00678
MTRARLQDLSEGELLARLFPLFRGTSGPARVLLGPGDDAAVLAAPSGGVVLTTDSMVRGRDWRDDWSAPQEVGRKVVAQNVADIAAMGAIPTGLLLALAADPATEVDWVIALAEGIAAAAHEANVPVLGGDLSSAGSGTVLVGLTAVGDLQGRDPVRRDGARAGDAIAVRGSLGHSGGGLQLLLDGRGRTHLDAPLVDADDLARAVDELSRVHRRTGRVPWRAGAEAATAGATAMIDVSDGLVRDLGRLAQASSVRAELDGRALMQIAAGPLTLALGAEDALRQVLSGGEEHSLVATFPPGTVPRGWQTIGVCAGGEGVLVDGEEPTVIGWDHFRDG